MEDRIVIKVLENDSTNCITCNNCFVKMSDTTDNFIIIKFLYADKTTINFTWIMCESCYRKIFEPDIRTKSKEFTSLWIMIERIKQTFEYIEKLESEVLLLHTKVNSLFKSNDELREYIENKFKKETGGK